MIRENDSEGSGAAPDGPGDGPREPLIGHAQRGVGGGGEASQQHPCFFEGAGPVCRCEARAF
eukprot:9255252-Pyramimonas_sp.AAC.1